MRYSFHVIKLNKKAVCKMSVAINRKEQETKWYEVSVWGAQAHQCVNNLKKGGDVFSKKIAVSSPVKKLDIVTIEQSGLIKSRNDSSKKSLTNSASDLVNPEKAFPQSCKQKKSEEVLRLKEHISFVDIPL